eukprot:365811-Chlamydomonas_euryale.AAC.6
MDATAASSMQLPKQPLPSPLRPSCQHTYTCSSGDGLACSHAAPLQGPVARPPLHPAAPALRHPGS